MYNCVLYGDIRRSAHCYALLYNPLEEPHLPRSPKRCTVEEHLSGLKWKQKRIRESESEAPVR